MPQSRAGVHFPHRGYVQTISLAVCVNGDVVAFDLIKTRGAGILPGKEATTDAPTAQQQEYTINNNLMFRFLPYREGGLQDKYVICAFDPKQTQMQYRRRGDVTDTRGKLDAGDTFSYQHFSSQRATQQEQKRQERKREIKREREREREREQTDKRTYKLRKQKETTQT